MFLSTIVSIGFSKEKFLLFLNKIFLWHHMQMGFYKLFCSLFKINRNSQWVVEKYEKSHIFKEKLSFSEKNKISRNLFNICLKFI